MTETRRDIDRDGGRRSLKSRAGRQVILRLPLTRHVFDHIRFELNGLAIRLGGRLHPGMRARRRMIEQQSGLSVNVACGGSGNPGWINLDIGRDPHISLRHDCRKGLPLGPGSALRIRCEHFLEHLDRREEVPPFLRSCWTSLQAGGVLRIIVPDAERYIRAYQSGDAGFWPALGWDLADLPEGFATEMDIINHVFRQDAEHRYAYDYMTLVHALRQAGFQEARRMEFGVSLDPALCEDLPNHRAYSLYVDTVKE